MKTDGGHEIEEKDLEEMGLKPGEEPQQGGHFREYTGTCKFCGQMVQASGKEGLSQAEVEELATCRCGCEKSQEYAKQKEQIQKAKARIAETFGSGAGEKALPEAIVSNLVSFVDIIAEKKMQAVTVDLGRGLKARVSRMAKGSIKVERTETLKASFEE